MLLDMNAMSIGQRVRQARQARDLTMEHLARRTGLSLSAVSELERDRTRYPQASTLVALARALDVSTTWLAAAALLTPAQVTLGQRLRAARAARGLTQTQLAAMVGVPVSRISKLEIGTTRQPSFVLLGAVAAALDVSPTWLAGLAPATPGEP
jgi:transcriptional regulator with XRE-family HTH domain